MFCHCVFQLHINMKFLSTILILSCIPLIQCWSCGEGKITEGLAWIIALPTETKSGFRFLAKCWLLYTGINKCCEDHDRRYDNFCSGIGSIPLKTADFLFERCLENTNNRLRVYILIITSFLFQICTICCKAFVYCSNPIEFLVEKNYQ